VAQIYGLGGGRRGGVVGYDYSQSENSDSTPPKLRFNSENSFNLTTV